MDFAIDVLINKCGDITYNCDMNSEILQKCLYNKCKKYLLPFRYTYGKGQYLSSAMVNDRDKRALHNDNKEQELSLEDWNVDKQQENTLICLSQVLEEGYKAMEAFEEVAQRLNLTTDEIVEQIDNIRKQNEKKKEERRIYRR